MQAQRPLCFVPIPCILLLKKLEATIGLPVIHIATATAAAIKSKDLKKVGLLGTKFTMELDFFTSKLREKGIETIIPGNDDRQFIHQTIFEELGRGLDQRRNKGPLSCHDQGNDC